MLGYADMREVMLWLQTRQSADVQIEYWEPSAPQSKFRTDAVRTTKDKAYTSHLLADQVLPGKSYEYRVLINNKEVKRPYPLTFKTQPLWRYRRTGADPHTPPELRIAVGSCAYVNDPPVDRAGTPYGSEFEIFETLANAKPDFMLWLGDNVYTREGDWTRTGIHYRYTQARSLPQLQPLLAACNHYATWDDHDYGPNDLDASFAGKQVTREAFELFWANNVVGAAGLPGITGVFEWGDALFFLMDNRWHRSANDRATGKISYLGDEQLDWLINALKSSVATFKVICVGGQVLNSVETKENYAKFAEERARLIELITKEKISGVVFLSGDRHFSELSILKREGSYPLHDWTVSSLTAGSNPRGIEEKNANRHPGSFVGVHNYGILQLTGTTADRKMILTNYDNKGKPLFTYTIKASELVAGETKDH